MEPIHEQPHRPSDNEHAQESWYFNWTDAAHDMFGLARIGFKYHAKQPEPLILTITGDTPGFIFPAEVIPEMSGTWDTIDAGEGLIAGKMKVTMVEPFKKWRIQLAGDNSMDLWFEAFTPVFDYHARGGDLAATMTTEHFEQSCRVTGWIKFHNITREISGFGQRDKSWGVRVWPDIQGWDWISAQFGERLTFNIMRTLEKDRVFVNGFVYQGGKNAAVTAASIDYTWGSHSQEPAAARLEIEDETGRTHLITAETRGIFTIPKEPVRLEEAYSVFTYHGDHETLTGGGVVEHVWRP